jgi:hypothetical protein
LWELINDEQYAELDIAIGEKVTRVNDTWWRQVRPYFYRPIIPFEEFDPYIIKSGFSKSAIYQHAVHNGQSSNSYLNYIFYPNEDYSFKKLSKNNQRKIKQAVVNGLSIREIDDSQDNIKKAYFIYKEFYERTKYSYGRKRLDFEIFSKWFRTVKRKTNATILGVFLREKIMVAFEISCMVGSTVILKEAYNSEIALKMRSSDFILDFYRRVAAKRPDIKILFDGNVCKKESINNFKIERGAKIMTLKAYLHIHPLILYGIKILNKNIYIRLMGSNISNI